MRSLLIILCLSVACSSLAFSSGRRPDDDTDGFPDYNKLEMRPRPRTVELSTAAATGSASPGSPNSPAAAPPTCRPALNTPLNPTPEADVAPQPPPKAVPLPDNASEPPLPQDIKDTLMQNATGQ